MKILAIALADETRRLHKGLPPKGAWLFLVPNHEIACLAGLVNSTPGDTLEYADLRTTLADAICPDTDDRQTRPDLALVRVEYGQEEVARDLVRKLAQKHLPHLLFGPLVTAWHDNPPEWLTHCPLGGPTTRPPLRLGGPGGSSDIQPGPSDQATTPSLVIGSILNTWPEIRSDAGLGTLRTRYRASDQPAWFPPVRPLTGASAERFGQWPDMNTSAQMTQFILGCNCPDSVAPWCPERIYYRAHKTRRAHDEIAAELAAMPGKLVSLLDDDVAAEPDYYAETFGRIGHYRRDWTVRAGPALFRHPGLIRRLAKSGVRVVFLNEDFIGPVRETESMRGPTLSAAVQRRFRQLSRRVKALHSARMLVGVRLLVHFDPERPLDFEPLAALLHRMDLDLLEPRFLVPDADGRRRPQSFGYRPMITSLEPGWLNHRFYAMAAILSRSARRPRRIGFYTTARYLLPYGLAYRQDFLEGLRGTH